jgi:hypothetical protein
MQTKTKIFFTLFLAYAFFTNTYLTTNDASRFSLTAAIVEEHSFEIDNFLDTVISEWWWAKDFVFYKGQIYSDKAPLGAFLGVPVYLILRFITSDVRILAYFVSLFTSGLLTATTGLMIYEIGKYFGVKEKLRITFSLAFGLGSAAFFYGTIFFSQAITSFFGFASFYLLFQIKNRGGGRKNLAFAGAASALAISSDYYAGVIALSLFGYALILNPRKSYIFLLSFLMFIFLLLGYHWAAFGDPFTIPYLHANLFREYHATGFYGMGLPDMSFFSSLGSQLFSPWGFFFTTPIALFSFASLPKFRKKYKIETALILFISAGLFYVAGSIGLHDAYSSRFLIPLVPFLFIPLYTLDYDKMPIKLTCYLIVFISILINLAGADTFLPEVPDPAAISETSGNHNLLGEFLLSRGIDLHFATIIPLLIILGGIWREEVLGIFKRGKTKD